ncbi:hypothetical protein K2173_016367 [Erythroxylum novogranatense]|uniref:GRAM domain-containing protein n=1 Tax=Erythroxylum novogranatense TaxID=1862640 RepID=A0AAV8SGQ4_9ROSI|nr:hypothetical protein K2173_016367 [Erythroxylum novogranatense]
MPPPVLLVFGRNTEDEGNDHGIKAQGDGWLLIIALIEGSNLADVVSNGLCDLYMAFTSNGKTRTSSIKFQQFDPMWNGKLSQACQSKLHLRIFLNNIKGGNVVKDYLSKLEKEVATKINLHSPQTNSTLQKLFRFAPEEFLINDFTCHLKRKMPVQGRLFLSTRTIGFHSDLFGHKTTFFFLWEDIKDIPVYPPTLSSMGSPVIVFTLRQGRGMDARHGAKSQDDEGRLKFHFYLENEEKKILTKLEEKRVESQKGEEIEKVSKQVKERNNLMITEVPIALSEPSTDSHVNQYSVLYNFKRHVKYIKINWKDQTLYLDQNVLYDAQGMPKRPINQL